jgi:hypothetical protein
MKKVSVFSLALFAGLAACAQNAPQLRTPMAVETRFGIKAGANMATTALGDIPTGFTKPETHNKTGFYGGVFVNIPMGQTLKFQPELLYSSQGTKMNYSYLSNKIEGEIDLNYLTLPLMLQYQTPGGFYVELGPQLGYMINKPKFQPANGGSETDLSDYSDKFDFSVNGGLGYMTRVGLGIGARYNYGITNAMDAKNPNPLLPFREAENRVIQVGLFYQFGASK